MPQEERWKYSWSRGLPAYNVACKCGHRYVTKTDENEISCPECKGKIKLKEQG